MPHRVRDTDVADGPCQNSPGCNTFRLARTPQKFSPAPDRAKFRENTMKSILRASLVCVVFAGSAVALTGERMAPIPLDKMSPAQRKVAEDIMSGPRGGMRGPFNAWLRSPE